MNMNFSVLYYIHSSYCETQCVKERKKQFVLNLLLLLPIRYIMLSSLFTIADRTL
uniref:Uncharacterized protein n=1 Tax=Anguilla anguilla TaxID=7936 RepID=A0A0E9PCF8_ANGAN